MALTVLDAAPLNAAVDRYCRMLDRNLKNVARRVAADTGANPESVDRALSRMREKGRVNLKLADEVCHALGLDLSVVYPDHAHFPEGEIPDDDMNDLIPMPDEPLPEPWEPVLLVGESWKHLNGNGHKHTDAELDALQTILTALQAFDRDAQERMLSYITARIAVEHREAR